MENFVWVLFKTSPDGLLNGSWMVGGWHEGKTLYPISVLFLPVAASCTSIEKG